MTQRIVHYFIHRPTAVYAAAALVVAAGAWMAARWPGEALPSVGPPTILVAAQYPGATAERTAEAVAAPLERAIAGLEGVRTTLARCTARGACELSVILAPPADPQLVAARIEGRVGEIGPQLPAAVREAGIRVRPRSGGATMLIALLADAPETSTADLLAAAQQTADALRRIEGVVEVESVGPPPRAVRVALDPGRLRAAGLTVADVVDAIGGPAADQSSGGIRAWHDVDRADSEQAADEGAEAEGAPDPGQGGGLLQRYRGLGLRGGAARVQLADVAEIAWSGAVAGPPAAAPPEGPSETATDEGGNARAVVSDVSLDGAPAVALAVVLTDAARGRVGGSVLTALSRAAEALPSGVRCEVAYDLSAADRASTRQMWIVLAASLVIVAVAAMVLMPGLREAAAMILSLLAVFSATVFLLGVLGWSLNWLTCLSLLAGIAFSVSLSCVMIDTATHAIGFADGRTASSSAAALHAAPANAAPSNPTPASASSPNAAPPIPARSNVSGAIEILVQANASEASEPLARGEAVEAAARAVGHVLFTGALIVAALGLLTLTIGGARGALFAQFGVPLAAGALLAWLAAITIAPATFVGGHAEADALRPVGPGLKTRFVETLQAVHHWGQAFFARRLLLSSALIALGVAAALYLTTQVPDALFPPADSGFLVVRAQMADGAAPGEIQSALRRIDRVLRSNPRVAKVLAIRGAPRQRSQAFALLDAATADETATFFVALQPWAQRGGPSGAIAKVAAECQRELRSVVGASCEVVSPYPAMGAGDPNQLDFVLRGMGLVEPERLARVAEAILEMRAADPGTIVAKSDAGEATIYPRIEIDRQRAAEAGIAAKELERALQAALAGLTLRGRFAAADQSPVQLEFAWPNEDLSARLAAVECRGGRGERFPLSRFAQLQSRVGPRVSLRHDGARAAAVTVIPSPLASRAATIARWQAATRAALPPAVEFEWFGLAAEEEPTLLRALAALAAALALAYVLLAAAFRNWLMPLAVLASMPLALLGAVVAPWLIGRPADLVAQLAMFSIAALNCALIALSLALAQRRRRAECDLVASALEVGAAEFRLTALVVVALAAAGLALLVVQGPGAPALQLAALVLLGGAATFALQFAWLAPPLFIVAQRASEGVARVPQTAEVAGHVSWELFGFLRYLSGRLLDFSGPRRSGAIGGIMTVTGPIAPEHLRATLTHEHVLIDFDADPNAAANSFAAATATAGEPPPRYRGEQVVARMRDFLDRLQLNNGRALIDATPAGMGRDPQLLAALSRITGIRILTNTGCTGASDGKYLPRYVFSDSVDELAARWIEECREGIDKTGIRPAFIKIGVHAAPLSPIDQKLVRAAARAHLASGLVIASTTPDAAAAFEQLVLLEEEGVATNAFIWVHAHREKNPKLILQAANAGAWVSFDEIAPQNVDEYARLVRVCHNYQLLERVLLSQNELGYQVGKPQGGKIRGYDAFFKLFIPALFRVGLKVQQLEQLTVINPMRAFTPAVRKKLRPADALAAHTAAPAAATAAAPVAAPDSEGPRSPVKSG